MIIAGVRQAPSGTYPCDYTDYRYSDSLRIDGGYCHREMLVPIRQPSHRHLRQLLFVIVFTAQRLRRHTRLFHTASCRIPEHPH